MSSVFEYATPSAKLRSAITRSSSAVAAIWLTPATSTQSQKAAAGTGKGRAVNFCTPQSQTAAKGKQPLYRWCQRATTFGREL